MSEYNECQPITIFPLGIACQTTNPSGPKATNGAVTLIVTGGTPPYNVTWGNGNTSFAINNLSVGSYPVTVVDYYGDFTASTACVLTASGTTTTTTSTTTTSQPTYDLCMVINYLNPNTGTYVLESIHFNPNGLVGGYQSWISDDLSYTITWDSVNNVWTLNDYGKTIVSNNPSYPPLNNWEILGYKGTITVTEGECNNNDDLTMNVDINSTSCENCDGAIILEGQGGVPPYEYSINGGETWSMSGIFQELCPDVIFNIKIKDSMGTIYTPPVNNQISFNSQPTITYTLNATTNLYILQNSVPTGPLSVEYETDFTLVTPLPAGAYITFNVENLNQFVRSPLIGTYSNNTTYSLIKNGNPISLTTQTSNNTTSPNTNKGCGDFNFYTTNTLTSWDGITITNGDVITLVVTSTLTKVLESCYGCCYRNVTNGITINGVTISNCECCDVQTSVGAPQLPPA